MVAARADSPFGREPPIGIRTRVLLVAAILVAVGLIYVLYGGPSDSGSSRALPYGTPVSPQTCSHLESPDNLSAWLSGLYNGFSLQNYSSGPNGTPALGISSYPNLTAGQIALHSA